MRVPQLINRYTRRKRQAEELDVLAPLASVYDAVLDDLRRLDGVDARPSPLTTSEAAEQLGVEPRTVAKWCRQGRLPNAYKTGEDGEGEWRIPPEDVDAGPTNEQAGDVERVTFQRSGEQP